MYMLRLSYLAAEVRLANNSSLVLVVSWSAWGRLLVAPRYGGDGYWIWLLYAPWALWGGLWTQQTRDLGIALWMGPNLWESMYIEPIR